MTANIVPPRIKTNKLVCLDGKDNASKNKRTNMHIMMAKAMPPKINQKQTSQW
jgi:hypothetical protein